MTQQLKKSSYLLHFSVKYLIGVLIFSSNQIYAQTIIGKISNDPFALFRLYEFNGNQIDTIGEVQTNGNGEFVLHYKFSGTAKVGFLQSGDSQPLILLLTGEDVTISGDSFRIPENFTFTKGDQNVAFEKYAKEHAIREQALSAWRYLETLYKNQSQLSSKKLKAINDEINFLNVTDQQFISNLNEGSFVKWYLPVRRIISETELIAQYKSEEIPSTLAFYRSLNYSDVRLYHSGLFADAIEKHVWLIENTFIDQIEMRNQFQTSINKMWQTTIGSAYFDEVMNTLFNVLEKRSLFEVSEYLALKLLNDQSCALSADLAFQLESYRKMKVGQFAENIDFSQMLSSTVVPKSLDLDSSDYKVVIFAAGWCQHCNSELPPINQYYSEWKKAGVDIYLIDLDTTVNNFIAFSQNFSFPCVSDLKMWDGKAVNDYFVFATPTLFVLNKNREIILKPRSVSHLKAWIDFNLLSKTNN